MFPSSHHSPFPFSFPLTVSSIPLFALLWPSSSLPSLPLTLIPRHFFGLNLGGKKTILPLPGDNRDHIQTSIDEVSKLPLEQTGLLFDNIQTAEMRVWNRKASGSGHGWAGAQTLFWNSNTTKEMRIDSPMGAKNWSIGSTTKKKTGSGFW